MTRPRPCAGCGVNPVAHYGREFCYDCLPRTWKKPPRCKLCGSTEDYCTNGRCCRCHRSAHLVGSCLDCLAWGVTRHFGCLCEACLGWRRRFSEPRECASCSRMVTVNARGYCRLCTRQAGLVRLPHCSIDVTEACRNGQQLYFAGTFRQKRLAPEPRPQPQLPWPGQYPVPYRQLVLFDAERDLTAGRRAGFPAPPLPGPAASRPRRCPAGRARRPRSPSRASGLPEPMAAEFRSWFEALRDGSRTPPRLRPRSTATIRVHVARAAPILHTWADEGRQSLREITRQDILGALPSQANQHRQALSALRSLFRFLKG
jgi:hypothetical protein